LRKIPLVLLDYNDRADLVRKGRNRISENLPSSAMEIIGEIPRLSSYDDKDTHSRIAGDDQPNGLDIILYCSFLIIQAPYTPHARRHPIIRDKSLHASSLCSVDQRYLLLHL